MSDAELTAVDKVREIFNSKNLISCIACRYCIAGCPKQISIPDLFACLGIGRVFPFLKAVNEFLESRGISLPLESQATTTIENRREAGTQAR